MTLVSGVHLGPYEILGVLGAGGMGEVYRARDSRLDRDVAVKVLPEHVASNAEALARFVREAKDVAALSHPNILSIHDFGSEGSTAYAVTELLEGETLRQRLTAGALTPRKTVELTVQIANGLASAHDKGIVHRDLKPENLFVTKDGRVKILDFGLATHRMSTQEVAASSPTMTRRTEPGVVLGTVGYMSPEQVRGLHVDHRTDIFALGAVVYEMLTGRRAFQRETAAETMTAILREDPPDLSGTERGVPSGLERLVRRCLEKSPDERLQSARDLAIALEAVSGGETSSARAALAAAPRRSPGFTAVMAALALGVAALGFWTGRRTAPKAGSPAAPSLPTFTQLTFRRGSISSARFAPDGTSVVYSATWDSEPVRLFSTRPDNPEASTAPLREAHLLAVSRSGELAVVVRPAVGLFFSHGTLARAPLGSGGVREVLEDVDEADWSADGQIAVVRSVKGRSRLEFPIGKVLYESPGWLSSPRFSPTGEAIAFHEHPLHDDDRGWPALVELTTGAKRNLASEFDTLSGLAWRSSGREVCFAVGASVRCSDLTGGEARRVLRGMPRLILQDISPDDRILASAYTLQGAAKVARTGGPEIDVGEVPASLPIDIDPQGGRVLFVSIDYGVHLTGPEGGPAVRLGDGIPLGLSPDGKQVLAMVPGVPTQLVLIPTGAGALQSLPRGPLEQHTSAAFSPDGRRIVISGAEKGHGSRLYVQDVTDGDPRPISGEGVRLATGQPRVVSPDGRFVAALGPDQIIALYPIDGGEPRPIPALGAGWTPVGWTDSPNRLFIRPVAMTRLSPVFRLDVASGRREPWREIGPSDRIGSPMIHRVQLTPDGRRYAYSYILPGAQLYLIGGAFGESPTAAPGSSR